MGASKKSTAVMSFEEKQKLWETWGAMNTETHPRLFNVVFYYHGLNFMLRSGDEHRDLKISQLALRRVPSPDNPSAMTECLVYMH